jgi:3-oxoadipate enol-lactonase
MHRKVRGSRVSLLIPVAAAAAAAACASGVPGSATPSLASVREAARLERFSDDAVVIEQLELGAAARGSNEFRARITNLTGAPLELVLDLRAMPGLWFGPNWQRWIPFELAPGEARVLAARYDLAYVSPEAALRIRFAPAVVGPDGQLGPGEPLLERRYAVGRGNPAAAPFHQQWRHSRTERFDIHARRGSLAERALGRIGAEREDALRRIEKILEVEVDERIRLVFYPDEETKAVETGHTGVGLARGATLVEVFNAETRLDPYHELAHIVGQRLGDPPALLNEGFATYISEWLDPSALDHRGHPGQRIEQVVCDLKSSGELIPLAELAGYVEIGSERSRPAVAYPQAASIVGHLIATTGLDPFREAYRQLVNSEDPDQLRRNLQAWKRLFGESIEETESAWLRSLDCSTGDERPAAPASARVVSGISSGGLHYETTGAGEAVVFVHGFSLDLRMWDRQVTAFRDGFRVVRYDLRGHGQSAAPEGPYTGFGDLRELLDDLGIRRATLVGLSAGSELALNFAIAYPDRVQRLVLAAPGLGGYRPPPLPWARPVFEAAGAGDAMSAAQLWAETPIMALHANQAAADLVKALVLDNWKLWTYTRTEQPLDPPAIGRLDDVTCPVLVVVGDLDLAHIGEVADLIARGVPDARLVTIAGAGHLLSLDAPDRFNEVVGGFLRGR